MNGAANSSVNRVFYRILGQPDGLPEMRLWYLSGSVTQSKNPSQFRYQQGKSNHDFTLSLHEMVDTSQWEPLPLPESLIAKMAETQQNPRYHAEGSVLAHTQYVLEKYRHLSATMELTAHEHTVLYWASVLHDIGKTKATVWQDGRWRSPGHEREGVPLAIDILCQHPEINLAQRKEILSLVRWHGFPLQYGRQGHPVDKLKLLSTVVDLRLLATFCLFDFEGRICDDRPWVMSIVNQFQQSDVPRVHYEFGTYAALLDAFSTANHRHKNALWTAYFKGMVPLLEKLVHAPSPENINTRGKKAIVAIGPPSTVKAAWIQQQREAEVFVISMAEHGLAESDLGDRYYMDRKLVEFKHFLTVYLNRYKTVILDGDHLHEAFRHRLNEMIRGLEVEIEYHVFWSSWDDCKLANSAMSEPLSEHFLTALYAKQDLIHPWEAHQISWHC